jgi:pimeloyl-ACP methyl ester carboxylesterase
MAENTDFKNGYSEVNGIKMYYEIYGKGEPLVLLHGGGSTVQSSFAHLIPLLEKDHQIIAVELQNHGRSGFRDVPETFEQDADDVAALLKGLKISKANFFGFSNGGTTCMQIGIRHPEIVNKLVLVAAASRRDGFIQGFFDGMQHASLDNMPSELKTAFLKVTPDSSKLQKMFERDRDRMIAFKDIPGEQITSIQSPTLIINGDQDVITSEDQVQLHRLIKNSRLAIIPGGHGKYLGEITTANGQRDVEFVANLVREFLKTTSNL